MSKTYLNWSVGHSDTPDTRPAEFYPAVVPGSVQADYARAKNWPHFKDGLNFRQYKWMEDKYWLYTAPLHFTLGEDEIAAMVFHGIDYAYEIRVGDRLLHKGEGMFKTVRLDVTEFSGKEETLSVLIYPSPKCDDSDCRDQARKSAKACACYGWDWHPRLVTAGIWDEAYLEITPRHSIRTLDASYRLSDDFSVCTVDVTLMTETAGDAAVELLDGDTAVASASFVSVSGANTVQLTVEHPKLWQPVGYGEQHRYTLRARTLANGAVLHERVRRIGFRRSRLVMNDGSWIYPNTFPKSRSDAPATLEINGRRIFAKGSNWVNAQVFPGEMNRDHYAELLSLVRDANMNILRIWGGGFVNKESFFDL